MKKNAFSYIELIFAMVLVVALMAMSGPFLTHKTKKNSTAIQGEYECWRVEEFDPSTNETVSKFCQHQKTEYDANFDAATCSDRCQFFRQSNITKYNITLYGAGGGGSKFQMYDKNTNDYSNGVAVSPIYREKVKAGASEISAVLKCSAGTLNTNVSNSNMTGIFAQERITNSLNTYHTCKYTRDGSEYNFDNIKLYVYADQIKYKQAQNGKSGSQVSFELPLVSMPFVNDAITIMEGSESVTLGKGGAGEITDLTSNTTTEAANGEETTFTAANSDSPLPSAFCTGAKCSASGGDAGSSSTELAEDKIFIFNGEADNIFKQKIRLNITNTGGSDTVQKETNASKLSQISGNNANIVEVLNQNRKYDANSNTANIKNPYYDCANDDANRNTIQACASKGGTAGEYAGITVGPYNAQRYLIGKICVNGSNCFFDEIKLIPNSFSTQSINNYFGDGGNGAGGAIRITW